MTNPTMVMPGHFFIAASADDAVGSGAILQGPEFRGSEHGFQINIGTHDHPDWIDCHEPVGVPEGTRLNFAVLDGNGARPI